MPSSKSWRASSSGSSSLSSRCTIFSSCWKAFSNSFARGPAIGALYLTLAIGGSGVHDRPDALDAQRLRVHRAGERSFLELHLDRIADLDGRGVEDRLTSIPLAREGDGVTARQHREWRDGLQRGRGPCQVMTIA